MSKAGDRDLADRIDEDTREAHRDEDRAQNERERAAIKDAARVLGLISAAKLTPAQLTRRGRKGGKACAAGMTKAQRQERASKAGRARWIKVRVE